MSNLTFLVAMLLFLSTFFGCANEPDAPSTTMTDSNLQFTPEEKDAIDRNEKLMNVLKKNNERSGTKFDELFPNAFPVSELQYWAPIDRPGCKSQTASYHQPIGVTADFTSLRKKSRWISQKYRPEPSN